jgi:hypothetical protein
VKRASTANGASIILYANEGTLNETWDVTIDSNGYATITSTLSGKVLDVRGGKAGNGAEVIQYAKKSTNARNQQWIAIKEADGSYKFVSALLGDTRYVLGVKGGTAKSSASLCLQPDGGASNKAQHFVTLDPPEQMAYRNALADGTYMFRSMLDATFCLDVSGNSKIEGAQVKLWTGKRSNNQLWQVSHDKNGFVLLKNKNSGKYLAFSAGAVGDSTMLLRLMVEAKPDKRILFAPIFDGKTMEKLRSHAPGEQLTVSIGSGREHYCAPVQLEAEVIRFRRIQAYHGQTLEDVADSVLLRCGMIDIVLTDAQMAFTGPECFESAGVRVEDYDVVVLKMGYMFAEIAEPCKENIMAFTPGCTPLLITADQYHNLPRPIWPLDEEVELIL